MEWEAALKNSDNYDKALKLLATMRTVNSRKNTGSATAKDSPLPFLGGFVQHPGKSE
jgi:hypothetical protein